MDDSLAPLTKPVIFIFIGAPGTGSLRCPSMSNSSVPVALGIA